MLDVHPPHHPTHTWKDFFIHIATICVGLLIAVALEQSVEHVHRNHEANELRDSLARETDKIIRDSEEADASLKLGYDWNQKVLHQIADAGLHHQPLGALPISERGQYPIADDPVYRAAKAGGQLTLLTSEEVQAYSEVDTIIQDNQTTRQENVREGKLLTDFISAASFAQPLGATPLATTSGDQLHQLYNLFVSASLEQDRYRHRLRKVWAAEVAISKGERDLDKIEAAENQFDNLP